MIFQYPVIALLVAVFTDITQAAGVYCEFRDEAVLGEVMGSYCTCAQSLAGTGGLSASQLNIVEQGFVGGSSPCRAQVLRATEDPPRAPPAFGQAPGLQIGCHLHICAVGMQPSDWNFYLFPLFFLSFPARTDAIPDNLHDSSSHQRTQSNRSSHLCGPPCRHPCLIVSIEMAGFSLFFFYAYSFSPYLIRNLKKQISIRAGTWGAIYTKLPRRPPGDLCAAWDVESSELLLSRCLRTQDGC